MKTSDRQTSISYFEQRMNTLGITDESNCFQAIVEGQPQQLKYFSEDRKGNIRILYRHLDGNPQTVHSKSNKESYLYINRLHPDNLSKNGGRKYMAPSGCGLRFFYPPLIIEAYQKELILPTLFITEGAFKAFKGCMHGLPIIGSMGIHTFSNEKGAKTLHEELKELIQVCQVKKLVFLLDSDIFDLSKKSEKPLTNRPFSFFSAIRNFRRMVEPLQLDRWFSYIKNEKPDEKLGLDDLLIQSSESIREKLKNHRKTDEKPLFIPQKINPKIEKLFKKCKNQSWAKLEKHDRYHFRTKTQLESADFLSTLSGVQLFKKNNTQNGSEQNKTPDEYHMKGNEKTEFSDKNLMASGDEKRLGDEHMMASYQKKRLGDEHIVTPDEKKRLDDEHMVTLDEKKRLDDEHMVTLDEKERPDDEHMVTPDEKERLGDEHMMTPDEKERPDDEHMVTLDEKKRLDDEHMVTPDEKERLGDEHMMTPDEKERPDDEHMVTLDEKKRLDDEHMMTPDEKERLDDEWVENGRENPSIYGESMETQRENNQLSDERVMTQTGRTETRRDSKRMSVFVDQDHKIPKLHSEIQKCSKTPHLEHLILSDLLYSVIDFDYHSMWFTSYSLEECSEIKLRKLFALDSVESFVDKYRPHLPSDFSFFHKRYKLTDDGVELIQVKLQTHLSKKGNQYFKTYKGEIKEISNFILVGKYLITPEHEETFRVIEIIPMVGRKITATFTIRDMISTKDFKLRLESLGNYFWTGNQEDLDALRKLEFSNLSEVRQISSLGYSEELDVFIWSNGIFQADQNYLPDPMGVVKHPQLKIFLPFQSKIIKQAAHLYRNERMFRYETSTYNFDRWVKEMVTVFGQDKHLAIAFYISSLFRDIIYEALGFFPILMLFGMQGSGKTSLMRSILRMFGKPQDILNLGTSSTSKSYSRKFAQFVNAIIGIDEYKNTLDKRLIETIKAVYDGASYHRAVKSQDNRTHSGQIHSACMLAGQELPVFEPSFMSRMIVLEFFANRRTEEQKHAFTTFNQLTSEGSSAITNMLTWHRETVSKDFLLSYQGIQDQLQIRLRKEGITIQDRLISNFASILAIPTLLQRLDLLSYPLSYDVILEDAAKRILDQSKQIQGIGETQSFWQELEILQSQGLLHEGEHYLIDNNENYLFIRFELIYARFSEFHHKQYRKSPIEKNTLREYLKRSKAFVTKKSKKFRGKSVQAMVFRYDLLGIKFYEDRP